MSQWRVFFGAVGLTLGPQLSASPGNLLELHVLDPIPNLLHQRLWERSPVTDALISSLDNPSADQHLKHSGLEKVIPGEKKKKPLVEGRGGQSRADFDFQSGRDFLTGLHAMSKRASISKEEIG